MKVNRLRPAKKRWAAMFKKCQPADLEHADHAGDAEDVAEGQTDDHEDEKGDQYEHGSSSRGARRVTSRTPASTICSAAMAAETGTAA